MNTKFKHNKDKELILAISPLLLSLFYGVVVPTITRKIPGYTITITRSLDHRIDGESVSDTHIEGRAVDIRIYDMPQGVARKICQELNFLLADDFGAASYSDGIARFAVLESDHIHLQIARGLQADSIVNLIINRLIKTKLNDGAYNIGSIND